MNLAAVKTFLDEHQTCVVATSLNDKPQAATVGFSVDEDYKILIATHGETRKAKNLGANPSIALVVGISGPRTAQIEGTVSELDHVKDADRIKLHFEKVPGAKKFASEDGQKYFLVNPTWLRFTDYTLSNPVFETEHFS